MAVKYKNLGVVEKKIDSGLVVTDKGFRSRVSAEAGDTLKQNLSTKAIEVVKAKTTKTDDVAKDLLKTIEEKDKEIEVLKAEAKRLKEEISSSKNAEKNADTTGAAASPKLPLGGNDVKK